MKPLPIRYLGKKSKYLHLFHELGLRRTESFVDLTAGSCSVAMFFVEQVGAKRLVLNDLSGYPKLIARVLFEMERPSDGRLERDIRSIEPAQGYLSENYPIIPRDGAAWMDGVCRSENDLLRLALSCLLLRGAPRFALFVPDHFRSLTARQALSQTHKIASTLRDRMHAADVSLTWTSFDYLHPEISGALEAGGVSYIDPAWPSLRGSIGNGKAYGLYASKMMSILEQRSIDYPASYDVSTWDFFVKFQKTIRQMKEMSDQAFVAFQTTAIHKSEIARRLFGDDQPAEASSDKNSTSTVREYLWRL